MLVVLIIFGGIMGALLVAFLIGKSSFLSADAYIQVQQGVRQAFDTMVKEIREANPGPGGTEWPMTVSAPGPTTGTQVDFAVALGYNQTGICNSDLPPNNCCQANAICYGAQDSGGVSRYRWRIRYRLNGTQLIREIVDQTGVVQAGTRVLTNDVNAAATSFTYDTASKTVRCLLEVALQSQQLAGGSMSSGTSPNQLETTVRLRN